MAIRIKKRYQGRQREIYKDFINEEIKYDNLFVITPNGDKYENISKREALAMAQEHNLDLVLISDKGKVPVAKIIDYSKHRFEKKKKAKKARKNQKKVEIKEVRLTPRIGDHDLQVKIKDARRFLEKGNKVKVSLRFRRNELHDQEPGYKKMNKIIEDLSDVVVVTRKPILKGIFLDMYLESNKGGK